MLYKTLVKPIVFLIDPERAHYLTVSIFKFLLSIPLIGSLVKSNFKFESEKLSKDLFGLHFKNPIGLAAGFDKDGKSYNSMSSLGFGFIEIGTVTPKPQAGNPKQRLFRLPKDEALINRMGFNNEGVDAMVERLKNRKKDHVIIGGNIGKNKVTPNEKAIDDYEICFNKLYDYVDYFVVNVSSPNTPDLRSLQDKEPLNKLMSHISYLRSQKSEYKSVLLKIAPDLSFDQIDDVLEILENNKIDGIICSNTTISREGLHTSDEVVKQIGNGGLSGAPIKSKALNVVKYVRQKNATIPIIGVGGINDGKSAQDMFSAGANLVQVYSGMVYQGPSMIKEIKKYLLNN